MHMNCTSCGCSYASFFFLAFVSEHMLVAPCVSDQCLGSLASNLAIIFGTRLIIGNVTELLLPYMAYRKKVRGNKQLPT